MITIRTFAIAILVYSSFPAFAKGWIVKLNRTQSADGFFNLYGLKGKVLDSHTSSRWLKVDERPVALAKGVLGAQTAQLTVSALATLPGVEYVEEDQIVSVRMGGKKPADAADPAAGQPEVIPNDKHFGDLWGLKGVDQKGSIRATHAWYHVRGRTLKKVVVGVLDTGVTYNHQDLKEVLWSKKIDGNTIGGIDAINRDYVAEDECGHGTHVSGTIAGQAGNRVGVAGVAPNARIFPLKFMGASCTGNMSSAIEALDMAYTISEIRVINHSWGMTGTSKALEEAFERGRARGILMVVSAGNESQNNLYHSNYPANIPLDNVISVAAIDNTEQLAEFSNYGQSKVHLGAPGVDIFSTINVAYNAYQVMSGTSMAAPHVTGAAAFVWGLRPEWTYHDVRDQLLRNARPISSLAGKTITGGTLDLYRAVKDL